MYEGGWRTSLMSWFDRALYLWGRWNKRAR